jgi:hypothetical protein
LTGTPAFGSGIKHSFVQERILNPREFSGVNLLSGSVGFFSSNRGGFLALGLLHFTDSKRP